MRKAMRIFVASILTLAMTVPAVAQAADKVFTHQETVERVPAGGSQSTVVHKQTTIERNETNSVDLDVGNGGAISSAVDLTGEVIALPFKLVAGVFDLVF